MSTPAPLETCTLMLLGFFRGSGGVGIVGFTRSALGLAVATIARRNGIPMGAGLRMAEERADALVELRADDVFELAGLRVCFGILDAKSVLEEALGQAVAADNVARALAAYGRELHFAVFHLYQMKIRHAGENTGGGLFCDDGEFSSRPRGMEALGLCRLSLLSANPDLFEQVIEADFVVGRNGSAAVRRVCKRAIERMARAVLQRIEMQMPVGQLDAAVGLACNVRIVRHHQDRVARVVQLAENLKHHVFVGFVKIAGRLVGKNQLRLIDECTRDGHALLLAAGKLRGKMG